MPSSSMGTCVTSAPYAVKHGAAPGYVGPSASTGSPRSTNVRMLRSMACWPPVVIMMSSTRARAPSSAMTAAICSRRSPMPSVGPYCSDDARKSVPISPAISS